jgi:hypothetical protein
MSGSDAGDRLARLAQLVRTLSAAGVPGVQLLVNGAKVTQGFPRIETTRPITFALLRTPDVPLRPAAQERKAVPDRH